MSLEFPIPPEELPNRIQRAGVAGAGGAGFPSYAKWQSLDEVDNLLINHQESEPNYYADKWLGKMHATKLTAFLNALQGDVFETIVIGTKEKYREDWTGVLEETTDATVYTPEDLPIDPADESGIVIAYTPDVYTYSEETVLLLMTVGLQIGDDLPTDHGWIVHNTESIYNISQAVKDETPVTHKYVQIGGNTPSHRCLEVPIGTTGDTLLAAAGIEDGRVGTDEIIADGGPGWCYEIDLPPAEFGVRKRTNGLLVLPESLANENVDDDARIDVLEAREWERDHETEPTRLEPDTVRIPLITNEAYEGFVARSEPTVTEGETVETGDVIATPPEDAISNRQHASIPGVVSEVTDTHVVIERT